MIEFQQYAGRFQGWRGHWSGLPPWGQTIVGIAAIPGLILAALSILMFVVSILALLILTVPVYSLLRRLTSFRMGPASIPTDEQPVGVKRVESTIVE